MHKTLSVTCALLSSTAYAADLSVSIEVPKLNVAEYHRPYVAVWIEGPDKIPKHLTVWYDTKLKDNEGTKWLKDMRLWWRRLGRELTFPADGVSGATKAPGAHELRFNTQQAPFLKLVPGEYRLMVEAAREVGGRELIELPFKWPAAQAQRVERKGQHELGAVRLNLQP